MNDAQKCLFCSMYTTRYNLMCDPCLKWGFWGYPYINSLWKQYRIKAWSPTTDRLFFFFARESGIVTATREDLARWVRIRDLNRIRWNMEYLTDPNAGILVTLEPDCYFVCLKTEPFDPNFTWKEQNAEGSE